MAGPRSFTKGLLGLASPDDEDRCQCVFGWVFGFDAESSAVEIRRLCLAGR